ncbi:multicopper oxidase domain-containing protein [Actinomadura rupiterrae]|uniref:multicopper oxidase domain-containing protein n=1 Tax=Actinomadura rupiterrae TaxID=559627 RepID=UPI0020A57EEF|nr:multicopper oxidase domain-containing protein [Actinomadura rupiterrae]MCP2341102.1 FtsP/CotA-like multicopper oxidase with cupredoxin domain [Actinomadura rupiterrae]
MLNRRDFLRAGAVGSGAALLPALGGTPARARTPLLRTRAPLAPVPFTAPLKVPDVLRPVRRTATTDFYELTVKEATAEIYPGVPATVLTYNGTSPGPTIRARAGRRIVVTQTDAMMHETSLHLHGGIVAADDDGHPCNAVMAGGSRDYHYPNKQAAATLWYHDHAHMMEAEHAFKGMAGFYLIGDPFEEALGLPDGPRDVPLMIRDARFDDTGQLMWVPDDFRGRKVALVNGTPQPYLRVRPAWYRLRLCNGGTLAEYKLALSTGDEMIAIASDGGLLPAPQALAMVDLTPGERAEVLVDFSRYPAGTQLVLVNQRGKVDSDTNLMRFVVGDGPRVAGGPFRRHRGVPSRLRPMHRLTGEDAVRKITLGIAGNPGAPTIDGKLFDMDRIDTQVPFGNTELWEVSNLDTYVPHNFHVHGVHFQVLDRNGTPVTGHETGWKDTVSIPESTTVRFRVRFDHYRGRYLYHCHLLDHSDMGMMAQMQIS